MTVNENFIIKKIELAKKYLIEARELFALSDSDILHSSRDLHTAERLFQLIVDYVLDVNKHLIKELQLETADDLQGTFYILADGEILSQEFSKKIADVVGLRNRIVHQYEKLDSRKFLEDFRKNNNDFDEYFRQIILFLDKGNI